MIHEQTVFTVEGSAIHARNFQGASKQLLKLSDEEGEAVQINKNGNFLVVGTSGGFIRAWDLSRREAREHGAPKRVTNEIDTIQHVAINCQGTRVAFLGSVQGRCGGGGGSGGGSGGGRGE